MQIAIRQVELAAAMGKVIRVMREARGLNQTELADHAGLTRYAVTAWENGRALPNLHNLVLLCAALDLPIWRLMKAAEMRMAFDASHSTPKSLEAA